MLREERVELSPPALDRIEAILDKELNRHLRPRVVPAARWSHMIGSAVRLAFPYSVAASLLIASCVWLETRVLHPHAATMPQTSPASLITDRPKNLQPALPEDPAPSSIPPKPQGG